MNERAQSRRKGEERGRNAAVARQIEDWIADYDPIPGVPDEFIDSAGMARSHWVRYFVALARYSPRELAQRFASVDRHVAESGLSYRVWGETNERAWPLGRLPLLIEAAQWRAIEAGVIERAEAWEQILADIYGDGALVRENFVPPAAIAGSNDFIRPMIGVTPPGGRWLRFYAVDIGRGPDGRWWVLDDRAQAPSGAGYALENRIAFARVFASLYRELNVERLAGFFRDFRDGLASSSSRSEPRLALMTPGPYSQTYVEQAYLARYLGLLLVEGDDLAVRDSRVHVRTIAGLKRIDVLWRRVDAQWLDPMELIASSHLGVPDLLESLRAGQTMVVNMPGAGLIESRSLLGFLPAMARRILGRDLSLPHIATWWCGQDEAAQEVLARFDQLAIASAFSSGAAGLSQGRPTDAAQLDPVTKSRLQEAIKRRGVDYVGQEEVKLSTMPVWDDGKLSPRPFVLRVFAAWTPQGWKVMPGGFCRVSDQRDARALSMGEGVSSADVWIMSEQSVESTTLLPTGDDIRIIRRLGALPSRAADNLFWFGRYFERCEMTLRILRAFCARSTDGDAMRHGATPARARLQRLLCPPVKKPEAEPTLSAAEIAVRALNSPDDRNSALSLARAARNAAATIRERLSPDLWSILIDLEKLLAREVAPPTEAQCFDLSDEALRLLSAIAGLVAENFNRVAGWSFLDMGRRVERGMSTTQLARIFADRDANADTLDVLLDLIDSQITYRIRYISGVALAPVRDMALLDPHNPRSVAFQVDRLLQHLRNLPTLRQDGLLEEPERIAAGLQAEIATATAQKLDAVRMAGFENNIMQLAGAIESRYFLQGKNAVRAETVKRLG